MGRGISLQVAIARIPWNELIQHAGNVFAHGRISAFIDGDRRRRVRHIQQAPPILNFRPGCHSPFVAMLAGVMVVALARILEA